MARSSLKNVMQLIDAAKEQLLPEQEFLNDFKRSMELSAAKSSRKPSQSYKPSSMNCTRNMYYQVIGADPDISAPSYTLIGIVNSGSDLHERIQNSVSTMKSNGMDCEYIDVADFVDTRGLDYLEIRGHQGVETKLYHKILNISFLCDGIIKYKNHYYILEIKSETTNKFWNRKGVDPGHYNQATAYSLALGLDNVLFLYVNRDIFDIKSYMFTVTDDMKQDLVGKIEECDGYVSRHIAPPKPEDVSKKACEYCPYRSQCRKDGK